MNIANDTDDGDWMDNFTRRRLGLPTLMHDGRTIPESLVHLADVAVPAIEADRDRYAEAYAVVAREFAEVKARHDAAKSQWENAVAQITAIKKFRDELEDTP